MKDVEMRNGKDEGLMLRLESFWESKNKKGER